MLAPDNRLPIGPGFTRPGFTLLTTRRWPPCGSHCSPAVRQGSEPPTIAASEASA
ncbi:hypothetical protein XOC_1016 [Xanthomonas oryzae pv. oryzicola BLS256]|uniref:Uncharacterized protein n=1 Tax=Xanthomonas oryzae pv. oryzicola (strain BLS256) TaxID=383407 RepID=G7TF49_XANOB|nr:hypothetical protein XOC_1016 [Xanthomonas oryzae pv. oryzicola BLS256]QEO98907.1 hypothetical protein XOCgx_3919 [Xanthomonas oryzae pv. oryzicola]